jgi:hypothetical protein
VRALLVVAGGAILAGGAVHLLSACSSDGTTVVVVVESGTDAKSSSSSSGGPVGSDCTATSDIDTCAECCRDQNQAAVGVYGKLVVDCYCQSDEFCKTVCQDELCKQVVGDAGSPCDLCLTEKNEKCGALVNPPCLNDQACAPILLCLVNASCDSKPQL